MDYKIKYLKYKNKYFKIKNIKGGNEIPDSSKVSNKSTHSWFIMPILLKSFSDIKVNFPDEFNEESIRLKNEFNWIKSIEEIFELIKNYYLQNSIELDNRRNLQKLNLKPIYDDKPFFLHLTQESQENILNTDYFRDNLIDVSIYQIISSLISKFSKWKYDFYLKDYKYQNYYDIFNRTEKIIKIQTINRQMFIKYENDDKSKIELYNNADVIIIEPENNNYNQNNKVLFCFGYWGDNNFGLFNTIFYSQFKSLVIYFIDRENKWYSNLMGSYISLIKDMAINYLKYTFLGLSMGGYGVLYASVYFPDKECITFSFSPQTLNIKNKKNILVHNNNDSFGNKLVDELLYIPRDIPDIFNEKGYFSTKIYLFTAKSERDDKPEINSKIYYKLDNFHIGAIINYPNISCLILNIDSHSLGSKIKINSVINLIPEHFDLFYNDQINANKLLFDKIKFT